MMLKYSRLCVTVSLSILVPWPLLTASPHCLSSLPPLVLLSGSRMSRAEAPRGQLASLASLFVPQTNPLTE